MKMLKLLRAAMLTVATLSLSGIAHAADLGLPGAPPPPQPVYVPAPVFTWTGFYIGGNLGVAWTKGDVTDSLGDVSYNYAQSAVFTGGGQVGANYQINWLVVGVEGDFDWLANNNNSSNTVVTPAGTFRVSANDRWITTLAARVGVANNNLLYYVKGGGGWVGVNNFTVTNVPTGASISFSNSNSNSGWLAGAGIEWAFAPNWTAKVEYDFLGLNNQSFTVPVGAPFLVGDVITTTHRDVQTLTVGINYLFNWHY
jgi:outer membrane immunogenic protein